MLTPITHDLLVAYATTLGELLRPSHGDALLREFLRREHLDAQDDLYAHLWSSCGGRLEVGRLVVTADSEGLITIRTRGRIPEARFRTPSCN